MFDPQGTQSTYAVSGQKTTLNQAINKGRVYTSVAVDDNSAFLNPSGSITFGYGTAVEEGPVIYRGIPNSNTILIDPSYTFQYDHVIGEQVNAIFQNAPYVPRTNGSDYAIYMTSPSASRQVVQDILVSLAAAGIVITFDILLPKYKYLISNPYNE